MHLVDSVNQFESTLELAQLDGSHYRATAGVDGDSPDSVNVTEEPDGTLVPDVQVAPIARADLERDFALEDNQQDRYTTVDGYPCTAFDRSLLAWLVLEWFYYG